MARDLPEQMAEKYCWSTRHGDAQLCACGPVAAAVREALEEAARIADAVAKRICPACSAGNAPDERGYHDLASMNCSSDGPEIAREIRALLGESDAQSR